MVMVPIRNSFSNSQYLFSTNMPSFLFEGEDILPGRKSQPSAGTRCSNHKDYVPPFLLGIEPTSAVTKPYKATMAPAKKLLPPRFEIETLPFDLIVKILCCLSSFEDLHSLIAASPICFRLFDSLAKSISMQVAKNMIGKGAWEEAKAVLIYQRDSVRTNTDPNNFDILKKELQSTFILYKTDITQIVANQQFFNSCAADFAAYVSLNYPRPQPSTDSALHPPSLPSTATANAPSAAWVLPPPSFTAGDTLSTRLFYKMWLLALQFSYESVKTFSHRPNLSNKQAADMVLVSKIMSRNRCFEFIVVPPRRMSHAKWEGAVLGNLFQILEIVRWRSLLPTVCGRDYLFLLKMLSHLAAAARGEGIHINRELRIPFRALLTDFPVLGVENMVEKYRLFGGWE